MTDKPKKPESRKATVHIKLTPEAHKALKDYGWDNRMYHSEAIIDMLRKIKAGKKK